MKKVFIDGEAGTTGLKIYKRLGERSDIKLISLAPEVRKDPAAIKKALNEADVAFLCLPDSASDERKRTLEAYGAELVLTDPERRMLAAIEAAEQIRDETGAWLPNQFSNPANPRIHYETTGPELWSQLDERIDAFVYGSGTGGTITGVGRFLK
jgi:threonine dehydratase